MKLSRAALLVASLIPASVRASPWFGTKYMAIVETEIRPGYTGNYLTEDPYVRTRTVEVSPTVTNPSVITSYTEIEDYSSQVTAVNLLIAPTAGVPVTVNHYVDYYVSMTYTAPSSCSYTTKQSLTTTIPVYIPYDAQGFVEPTWIQTTTEHFSYITGSITDVNALLNPTDIPESILSSASSKYKPAYYTSCYSYYADSDSGGSGYRSGGGSGYYSGCSEFTWYFGSSAFSGGVCCYDGCHYTWGITPWGLALAVFFSWFGLFLIIGIVESWFFYRRAMLGGKVRRGFPYAFTCLFPILSCLFLLTVKKYPAKTPDQQAFLAARWAEMSSGAKISSWLKKFFKRSDPAAEALGITAPVPPQMAYPPQGQPQWYPPPGPSGAHGMPPSNLSAGSSSPPPASQGYQGSDNTPRGEELEAESKVITVNETEHTSRT